MNILGIVTKTHDTGAAILRDGAIAAMAEEERHNRDKHTQLFPFAALEAALETAGIGIDDIDVVTTPWDVQTLRRSFRQIAFAHFPASLNLLKPAAHAAQNSGIVFLRQRLNRAISRKLGARRRPEIVNVAHHDAHAAAFFASPFDDAAILVMDGYGDQCATSAHVGEGNRIRRLWQSEFFDSLGAFYSALTMHLGFKLFEEGTVMALAACGERTYVERFRNFIRLNPDGSFKLNPEYLSFHTHGLVRPFTQKFIDEFGPPRAPSAPIERHHRDLATAMQAVTEDAVLNLVRSLEHATPSRNLCISGGVALNCVANGRVLAETKFTRVWVPPCASDTGAPLGSALWHHCQTLGKPRTAVLEHAYHGKTYTDEDVESALTSAGLSFERLDDETLIRRVARDIASAKIVGWFQGRYEIGPRALGNRSILADPRDPGIRNILNARIKHREPFRPFAPAVLAERAADFFEISQPDPFMTLAPHVRPDKAALLPAAVHVDGTGRIQTVDKRHNPRFHALISEFGEVTGVPILINTSFNRQEPIVCSPSDAVSCYLRTSMDVLAIHNYYVTDRSVEASAAAEAGHQARREAMQKRLNPWRSILEY